MAVLALADLSFVLPLTVVQIALLSSPSPSAGSFVGETILAKLILKEA